MPTPLAKKPPFTVAAGTVAALVALAGWARMTQGYVPERAESSLAIEAGDFVKDGSREAIRWRTLSQETLARARKADLPVLLVVGLPWSRFAQQLDRLAFSDQNVAAYINRNFTAIRVDGLEHPNLLRCFLPITRGAEGFLPYLQIWAATPRGQIFSLVAKSRPNEVMNPGDALDVLAEIRERFVKLGREGEDQGLVPVQAEDVRILMNPELGQNLRFDVQQEVLQREVPPAGGFAIRGMQRLSPQAHRFLILTGAPEAGRALDGVLDNLADLVRGGFFLHTESTGFEAVHTGKTATSSAEMAEVLALRAVLDGDPVSRWFARRTIEGLVRDFSSSFGFFEGLRVPEDKLGRSDLFGFSPSEIRALYPGEFGLKVSDRGNWVWRALGLGLPFNRLRLPRLTAQARSDLERTSDELDALRAARPLPADSLLGQGYADPHGHTAARLLEAARWLGDPDLLLQLEFLVEQNEIFATPLGVRHRYSTGSGIAYSPNLVAIADSALQAYLCYGSVPSLLLAADLLGKFTERFMTDVGPLMTFDSDPFAQALGANGIELTDSYHEGGMARAARLALRMQKLVPKGGIEPSGFEPQALANTMVAALSAQAGTIQALGFSASGLFNAGLELADDVHAFAVGPDAVAQANLLASRRPGRLIAPALGPVREDLQRRPDGFYVVTSGDVEGPLSLGQAMDRIPTRYRIDRAL